MAKNKKKNRITVKKTSWLDGVLNTFDQYFDTIEAALEFVENAIDAQVCKTYNELGELLHVKHHSLHTHNHDRDHDGHRDEHHGHGHGHHGHHGHHDDDGYHYPKHEHHHPKK